MIFKLSEIINELAEKGNIILCGDYNSRIGDHPCLVKYDELNEHIPLPNDYIPNEYATRNSRDKHKNNYATDFSSMIMNNNLTILNGRTLGDLSGSFTCVKPTGSSVVDYMAVSQKLYPNAKFFEVLPFTPYSDHRPIQLTLRTSKLNLLKSRPINQIFKAAPCRFLFNEDSKKQFVSALDNEDIMSQLNEIKLHVTASKACNQTNREDIININKKYTEYLQTIASNCFKLTKTHKNRNKKIGHTEPWFNHKCKVAKRELNNARAVSNNEEIDYLRFNFYHVIKILQHTYQAI